MKTPISEIANIYDADLYAKVAFSVAEEIQSHLKSAHSGDATVARDVSPHDLIAKARALMNDKKPSAADSTALATRAREIARTFLDGTTRLHHPNCMGHQVNPPVPFAGAMTALGGVLNPGLAVFEMSQFASAVERAMIAELGPYVGWKAGTYDGIVTSGGTLANMTAVLSARNKRYKDVWIQGFDLKKGKPALLVGADSHYSISRAAGVLGLGTDQVVKVPLDSKRRIDVSKLQATFDDAKSRGLDPFCLVGAAGTTPYGAVDPLEALADFAAANGLWLHVDAAHGGSLLLSKKYCGLLKGVERADSITWDAHKMMFVPSLCTFLLYKEKSDSYRPFQQDAPYIFAQAKEGDDRASFDMGLRTFECTKGPIATPVWALWSIVGPETIAKLIEHVCLVTTRFAATVRASGDFVALHEPECNIFCFRYVPASLKNASAEQIGELQSKIRERLIADGRFYTTGTMIDGAYALRVTIINPLTEDEHVGALLEEVREIYKTLA
jgi:L-2,4-diaminobutyrate decarboxylase